jgi:hypothetical protein
MTEASTARARRQPVLAILWAAALGAVLLVGPLVSAAAGAESSGAASPLVVTYSRSLLRSGDFARQYTGYQCVGAALQMMRNMTWNINNRGPGLQKKLWRVARANSRYKADGGADPFGWTTATTFSTIYGRYVLVASDTMSDALQAVAKGIATTGRPAGAVVWKGTHAWVITGFESTADPNETDDFQVISIRMADPLWRYRSIRKRLIYRPGTRLTMGTLKGNFTPYHDARRDPRIEGQYVVIVPVADDDAVPDGAWIPKGPGPGPTASPTPSASPTPEPTPTEEASAAP